MSRLNKALDKDLKITQLIDPKAYATGDSPVKGAAAVDRAANGSGSVAFVFNVGAVASSGIFAIKLQESDTTTDGDFTDVAAGGYSTALVATVAATKQETSYLGNKRYVRPVLTYTSGTSVVIGVTAIEARGALPA